MGKRIINGQKMLLMKQLHNKNYLIILASFFLVTYEIGSTEPIYSISKKYEPAQKKISYGKNGMVTTQHFIATKVGEEILSKGDRKSTRLNSSHSQQSRMPSSA